jgi:hypothetical protein
MHKGTVVRREFFDGLIDSTICWRRRGVKRRRLEKTAAAVGAPLLKTATPPAGESA